MSLMSKARGLGLVGDIRVFTWLAISDMCIVFPLVSATSTGLKGIYLLKYKWNSEDGSWLRLGYYGKLILIHAQGLCIVGGKHSGDRCLTTTGRSGKDLYKGFGIDIDNRKSFDLPLKLQHDVFTAFMTAGRLAWFISLILISLVILRGSSAGRLIRSAAKATSLAGATLMIASAWATNSAVKALEIGSDRSMEGGTLLYGLQWVASILAFFFAYLVSSVADSDDGGKAYHLGRV
ncbi:hypothetical protein E4T47_07478 [Aureobasidium subglaciale]|nr:hypothetical protein E4T47_07478 [Aureobasidium subglaciale]